MGKKKILIITGITGFIGSEVVLNNKFLDDYKILGLNSKNFFLLRKELEIISKNKFFKIVQKSDHVDILHLATFYDLNEESKEKIYNSNYLFGKKFFQDLINYDIKLLNILYTNTVFSFSSDTRINNSTYVKSKNEFSKFLYEFANDSNINFNEIFLSNTIGINDFRDKLIPNMVSSLKLEKSLNLENPNLFINILDIDIIINEIYSLLQSNNNAKYSFLSKKEYLISSINSYLTSYLKENIKNKIEFRISNLGDSFSSEIKIKYFDFDLEKILDEISENT